MPLTRPLVIVTSFWPFRCPLNSNSVKYSFRLCGAYVRCLRMIYLMKEAFLQWIFHFWAKCWAVEHWVRQTEDPFPLSYSTCCRQVQASTYVRCVRLLISFSSILQDALLQNRCWLTAASTQRLRHEVVYCINCVSISGRTKCFPSKYNAEVKPPETFSSQAMFMCFW